ncbi:hypothetical protein D3C86_2122940 [compost metagenome]
MEDLFDARAGTVPEIAKPGPAHDDRENARQRGAPKVCVDDVLQVGGFSKGHCHHKKDEEALTQKTDT